ncbi:MAG: tetratricopeptide repeat protein [Bacteroidota bacterium]|jgi:tetratricopeptide (TPR) repeat protein
MDKFRILFFISICGIYTISFSQSKIPNENQFDFYNSLPDDTAKAEKLYSIGFSLRAEDPMLSFAYAKELYKCAINIESKKYEAKAYSLTGILNYRGSQFNRALEYHFKAIEIRENLKDQSELGKSYTNVGNVYSDLGNFELSEKFHLKALNIFTLKKDEKQILNCLCNLGVLKHAQKEDSAAIKNLEKALMLAEQLNDYESRAMCCNNLGLIYEERKNWEMALNYYFENVRLNEQMDTKKNLASGYFNLGSVYTAMKNKEKATEWLEKSLKIATNNEYDDVKGMTLEKMAEISALNGNYKFAYEQICEQKKLAENSYLSRDEISAPFILPEAKSKEKSLYENILSGWYLFAIGLTLGVIPFIFLRPKKKKSYE